jgi:2'-5' RNA ligase
MEIRSFLAFRLPGEIQAIVSRVSEDAKRSSMDARWVHLTVVFLGSILLENVEPIGEVVTRVCQRHGPFHILLRGVGQFGGRRDPRVLWIGLEGDIERMGHFRDGLLKRLKPFGIKQETRKFRPHLTLGRFGKGPRSGSCLDDFLSRYRDLTSPLCTLGELTLFKSELKPGGAVYSVLKAWPLDGEYS